MIASNDPAIREVAGECGAMLLDVRDRSAWLEALRTAITQPAAMHAWRERAVIRSREFSWTKTAKLTKAVYEQAIRRFSK